MSDPEPGAVGPAGGPETAPAHPGWARLAITLGAIAVGVAVVLAVEPLRDAASSAVSGDTEALREEMRGVAGVAILLVMALLHAVVFYPAEILDAAAGLVYGFWLGLLLTMAGWLLNAWVAYEIGRNAARPLMHRLFGRDRFERYESAVERGGVSLLLAMRLIPIVPFSLFSYAAGAARVPLARFLWTTAVGYVPITALFVYFGTRIEELSPTDPVLIAGAVAIVIVLVGAHRVRGRLGGL